jgi:hypothetical protein
MPPVPVPEPTPAQTAEVLRRLTRRTDEIDSGVLRLPGDSSIELVTVRELNTWLMGLAVRVENGHRL